MSQVIWKYPLEHTDRQEIQVPIGAKILTAQKQDGQTCLWVLVNRQEFAGLTETRIIETHGTGNPMDDAGREYIGTVQSHGGLGIWHIFEVKGD